MSFRNRLLFFFVVIVIVPMIAVAVVLFRLISDNQTGKYDAAFSARATAALAIYRQDASSPAAVDALGRVARDPRLGRDLDRGDIAAARRRALALVHAAQAPVRIELLRGTAVVLNAQSAPAIAPIATRLVTAAGRTLGRLEVSVTSAATYAAQVQAVTTLHAIVRVGSRVLAANMAGIATSALPAPDASRQLTLAGTRYQASTSRLSADFAGRPVDISLLADARLPPTQLSHPRTLTIALIAVFLVIALSFAILVSRSLQLQIAGFLAAARQLRAGDFSVQVPIVGSDQFAELGEEFNEMARTLEERRRELSEQQERLEGALRRTGEASASNLDRDALLEIILRNAVDGVGAVVGRASLCSEGDLRERVRFGHANGFDAALTAVERGSLAARSPCTMELGGVTALAHPLTVAQDSPQVLGMLSVARSGRGFTAPERELFGYLALQAAVSIENLDLHERLQRQAVTDDLTGLYNHRRFQEAIASEMERARRFSDPLGLVMLDIDDFKQVNDTYGHQQGDLVLRHVARVLRSCSREIDAPARYGGEELAILLPGTDVAGAHQVAERVRRGIAALRVPLIANGGTLQVTVSLGAAAIVPTADQEARDLIGAADAALYEAKDAGKNNTVAAQ